MRPLSASFVVVMAASTAAFPASFWVATTGSDLNPGNSAQPWATLQHAVENIAAGDAILVRSGTYAGFRIENSGLANAFKRIQADAGASVLVNAAGPKNRHASNIEVELFGSTIGYWVISGFEVANSARYGIDIRVTTHVVAQNCNVHDSARTGIFTAFSDFPLIQNNQSAHNGEHGIYHSNSGDHPTIRGNNLHHNHGAGVHMNGDFSQQPGDGIITSALVEKNVIWENGTGGGSGINCDGVSNSIFRNNLLYNNHASGISLYAIDAAQGSSGNLVANNTIVMAAGSRWPLNIPSSSGVSNPLNNIVADNILYTPDAGHGSVLVWSGTSGLVSDYNVVVDRFSADDDNTVISLAQWRTLGYDAHSIIATPAQLFVDPANNNYHLKPGSPAIGKGAHLSFVHDDLDGIARPAGPYDIGCYNTHP